MGGVLKNIIIVILLAVLAFIAGSLAADGAQAALVPAVIVLGCFLLIYLGKNCWWLVFLAPPLMSFLDLSFLHGLPISFLLCGVILAYWLLMFTMGYVKLTWHGVIWMDIMTAIFVAYFLFGYVRHPVSLGVARDITDADAGFTGGKEYVWCLAATLAYVTVSVIPSNLASLFKVFKYLFILGCILAIIMTARRFIIGGGYAVMERAYETRSAPLGAIGGQIYYYMLAKLPLVAMLLSPWKLAILFAATFAVLMGGGREGFAEKGGYALSCVIIHRNLALMCVLLAAGYGTLLYLSSEKMLYHFPHGVQRVLTVVPGLDVEEGIKKGASHSWQWRVEMWEQALEPTSGYIKDYVWGDGFGQDIKQLRLTTIAMNRGEMGGGDQRFFMETGTWHSGIITSIHRTGYVGLVLNILWSLFAIFMVFRVGFNLKRLKDSEFAFMPIFALPTGLLVFYGSAGTYPYYFGFFYTAAVAKVLYRLALKEGIMGNLFTRTVYVPLMLQQQPLPDTEERPGNSFRQA